MSITPKKANYNFYNYDVTVMAPALIKASGKNEDLPFY